ncbi:MAG: S-adenosylmethionine-binding protein, partial [Rhodospirillales bacterium]|nr:S-adenosylmethionine-binding protein [Rhodospirillales bacterium]
MAYPPHPYAALFPMMAPKALGELIASVGRDGLQDPIITFEGKVLDGRNRQLACSNASVKPVYKKYTGDDPLGFVI